jgi:hypothetical protein
MDTPNARISILWGDADDFKRLELPLNAQTVGGSPPLVVTELLQKSWQLREATPSACGAAQ